MPRDLFPDGADALDKLKADKTALVSSNLVISNQVTSKVFPELSNNGRDVMMPGGPALLAAAACSSLLEDNPVPNAG